MSSYAQCELSVAELCSRYWPGARCRECLGGGHRNEMWLVEVDGVRYAARRSQRPGPALRWELRLLDHLADAGIRVPHPLPALDGRRLIAGVTLWTWLEGEPPTTDADWRAVTRTIARVHQVTRGWRQRPGFRAIRELLTERSGGDVRLDAMPDDAVALCREAWRALDGWPMSVIHGDPGAQNIRVSRDGIGLLDWDESRVDVTAFDFADIPLDPAEIEAELRGIDLEVGPFLTDPVNRAALRRATDAWEAANGWRAEPEYARRRLAALG